MLGDVENTVSIGVEWSFSLMKFLIESSIQCKLSPNYMRLFSYTVLFQLRVVSLNNFIRIRVIGRRFLFSAISGGEQIH